MTPTTTYTYVVSTGGNDTFVEYSTWGGTGTFVPAGGSLVFGARLVTARNSCSVRFVNVVIPVTAHIVDARLSFTARLRQSMPPTGAPRHSSSARR